MSESPKFEVPKFEVIDRRKFKAEEEERETAHQPVSPPQKPAEQPAEKPAASESSKPAAASAGPRLVEPAPAAHADSGGAPELEEEFLGEMPPPTAEESSEQKTAYDASAQRLEDLARAQNPGMGAAQPVTFDQLVQQFYVSAMIQMGAGTPEGQRPRVDILGARQTIDMLGILAEKTRGNLSEVEDRTLQTVLYEARMAFLEVTRMITLQGVAAPAPPKGAK
jgi:Domain of unknown function (DUF1844)